MNQITRMFGRSALVNPPNTSLTDLPAWKAPSFWMMFLAVLITGANMLGIDLLAVFDGMGIGASPEEVIETGKRAVSAVQTLLPIVLGIFGYLERGAPHFRLRYRSKTKAD